MITQKTIDEADKFFEWPGEKTDSVTLTSCLLFAEHMVQIEREACAMAAEGFTETRDDRDWVPGSLYGAIRNEVAARIRSRNKGATA